MKRIGTAAYRDRELESERVIEREGVREREG